MVVGDLFDGVIKICTETTEHSKGKKSLFPTVNFDSGCAINPFPVTCEHLQPIKLHEEDVRYICISYLILWKASRLFPTFANTRTFIPLCRPSPLSPTCRR